MSQNRTTSPTTAILTSYVIPAKAGIHKAFPKVKPSRTKTVGRRLLAIGCLLTVSCWLLAGNAHAAGATHKPTDINWPFENEMNWDKDKLYRGYKVATQVCLACHSFKYISHRQLMNVGFTEDEVRALAAELNMSIDDKLMSGLTDDIAIELYGKKVPDMSVMNKARYGKADYVYALLTHYSEDEEEIKKYLPDGLPIGAYFSKYYPGYAIAMPNPFPGPDLVEYHDGTEATIEQMAKDVTYFMQYTAEPELMDRKRLGVYVMIYLIIFTLLAYFTKRIIWRDVH